MLGFGSLLRDAVFVLEWGLIRRVWGRRGFRHRIGILRIGWAGVGYFDYFWIWVLTLPFRIVWQPQLRSCCCSIEFLNVTSRPIAFSRESGQKLI